LRPPPARGADPQGRVQHRVGPDPPLSPP
jgi:hypothetical protein